MWHDLRYSIRLLSKSRGFTALAVAVLAVGIGINAALFSIVYAIFFRPCPFTLLRSWSTCSGRRQAFASRARSAIMGYWHYEYFRDHSDAFASITGHWGISSTTTADEQTDLIRGEAVFANYFDVLGVKPILGRAFRPEEDDVSNPDIAVVISHSLWTRRFNSSPDVIGRQIRMSDWSTTRHVTIVGVMGPGFNGASDPWTPSRVLGHLSPATRGLQTFWLRPDRAAETWRQRAAGADDRVGARRPDGKTGSAFGS